MAQDNVLEGLKNDMSALLAAIDVHMAEVRKILDESCAGVSSVDLSVVRVQISEAMAKLAVSIAPPKPDAVTASATPATPAVATDTVA